MGRVINPESAGKDRTRLVKTVFLALRELMKQQQADDASRDLAAYISVSLVEITETVEESVAAWEKKGYWVKADRFRMEWAWTGKYGRQIREGLANDDWAAIAMASAQVAQKLMNVDVPAKHKLGTPWVGAYQRMLSAAQS